ncbi:MAG: DUF3127 domain-containing protein [Bacteroidales bacterium]|nr:DUF3127 domain-containing protein [Bacteroidales bacterium]
MEISGKIIHVLQVQAGTSQSGRQWKSLDFVIETQESHPRKVCFNLFGDERISQNPVQVGQEVAVSFDVESREWQGKWFTKCSAFRVAPMSQQPQYQQPMQPQYGQPQQSYQQPYATQPPQQYQPQPPQAAPQYPGQQYAQMAQPSQQVPPAPSPTGYPNPTPGLPDLPF